MPEPAKRKTLGSALCEINLLNNRNRVLTERLAAAEKALRERPVETVFRVPARLTDLIKQAKQSADMAVGSVLPAGTAMKNIRKHLHAAEHMTGSINGKRA